MRVFMLGWEFPPFISGGLGTACYGLTKAISDKQTQVVFVLPKAVGSDYNSHVRLLGPQARGVALGDRGPGSIASTCRFEASAQTGTAGREAFANVTFKAVPSQMRSSYPGAGATAPRSRDELEKLQEWQRPIGFLSDDEVGSSQVSSFSQHYGGDLIQEAHRYAGLCVDLSRAETFDVIHAHDWLTFPAGLAVAAVTGKPLVVHVHSTEFDRAGENINQRIFEIERRGMFGAMRIIAVSHFTKSIIVHRYRIDPRRIDVVYNGIENGRLDEGTMPLTAIRRVDKIVLFLGRITMQKGPEYFVEAAKKVLRKFDQVKFVMAGSGDMVADVIQLAARRGIGQKVIFTGFLSGKDVERVFKMADIYVMPSVSEPFGIAPLEAIRHDVPVIISKQSGVSEVLSHALKVDFWDTDEMANKILAVLRHPPLSHTLRQQADLEVRRLTWDDAADKCLESYQHAIELVSS